MKFFQNNGVKCVIVLMIVTIVSCGLLAVLNGVLKVTDEERTARAIQKVYGTLVEYDDLGVTEEQYENSYGTVESVYLVGSDYLIKATGANGYKGGTITMWSVFTVENGTITKIGKVLVESNTKQTLMSALDANFLSVYLGADASFLNGDGAFVTGNADSNDIQNVSGGATKSSNAADNAVNAALYYVRTFVTGGND